MRYLFLLLAICFFTTQEMRANTGPKDSITVYLFLHDACVICQNYTLKLNELHQTYADENLQFVGVFPNFSSKPKDIEAFRKKYSIPFELKTDYFKSLSQKLGAKVTPEVIIYSHEKEQILYRGRIDNTYFRVGKRRSITTTSELEDVLKAIQNNQSIAIKETEAVGCVINYQEGPKI
jgi:peroxiredoxin